MKILTSIDREIYLIDDIGKHMSVLFVRRLKQQMDRLAGKGALVFFLSTDERPVIDHFMLDETAKINEEWLGIIDSLPEDIEEMIKEKKEEMRGAIEKKK